MNLAEFLDDRCSRFVRDGRYRVALVRERYPEEVVRAEERRRVAEYKKRKKARAA